MKIRGILWVFVFALFALPFGFNFESDVACADTVYSPQSITIENSDLLNDITIDGQVVYVSDENRKLIYNFDTQSNNLSTTDVSGYGTPGKIAFNYADNLVCQITNLGYINKILLFNGQRSEYTSFNLNGTPYGFPSILDIAQSSNNTVFAVVSGNGNYYLVKKEPNAQNFVSVCQLTTPLTGVKLAVNLTGTIVLMLANNTIYDLSNGTQAEQTLFNVPALSEITSIFLDHKNDLFILDKVSGLSHCTSTQSETIALQNASSYIDFCINPFNQTIYLISTSQFFSLTNTDLVSSNFLNSVITTPSVNISTDTISANLKTGSMKTDSFIYTYDNLMQKTCAIKAHTGVIILDEMDGDNFFFVLDTSGAKNTVGYVLKEDVAENSSTTETKTYQTIYQATNVYPFPTSLKTSNEENVRVLTTLPQGIKVTTISTYVLPTDSNKSDFALISVSINNEQKLGFVDTRTLCLVDESQDIKTIFVPNALTRSEIQVFEDDELQTPAATLAGKAEIQIISRNQNICYVMWEDEGTLRLGYAKYEDLNDGSITIGQIIGLIVMLLALIAIAVTFRFIKNSRKKLDLRYEK